MPRGLERRGRVAGEHARLHLADPVPAFRHLEVRVLRESTLSVRLVELIVVQRSESACEPAQRSDEGELGGNHLDGEAEARLVCERESALGFAFYVHQVI